MSLMLSLCIDKIRRHDEPRTATSAVAAARAALDALTAGACEEPDRAVIYDIAIDLLRTALSREKVTGELALNTTHPR